MRLDPKRGRFGRTACVPALREPKVYEQWMIHAAPRCAQQLTVEEKRPQTADRLRLRPRGKRQMHWA